MPSSAGRARWRRRAHLQGTSSSRCHSKKSSRQAARHSSHRLPHTAGRRPTPTRGSHTLRAYGAALAPAPCSRWPKLCSATARAAPAREARDDRLAARRERVVGQRRSQAAAERGRVRHVAAGAPGELRAEGQGLGLPGGLLQGRVQPQGALCAGGQAASAHLVLSHVHRTASRTLHHHHRSSTWLLHTKALASLAAPWTRHSARRTRHGRRPRRAAPAHAKRDLISLALEQRVHFWCNPLTAPECNQDLKHVASGLCAAACARARCSPLPCCGGASSSLSASTS
jgi:hypothetical protein